MEAINSFHTEEADIPFTFRQRNVTALQSAAHWQRIEQLINAENEEASPKSAAGTTPGPADRNS